LEQIEARLDAQDRDPQLEARDRQWETERTELLQSIEDLLLKLRGSVRAARVTTMLSGIGRTRRHIPGSRVVIQNMTYQTRPTAVLGLFTLTASLALAQPAPRLEFEVASIKPAAFIKGGETMSVDAGRLEYSNVALRDCIRVAYRIKDYQVSGPDWLASTRFDIVAKLPEGATREQAPEMLQALLADRFKLTFHHETKDHNVYALVAGKNGPKLTPSDPDAKSAGGPGGGSQQIQSSATRSDSGNAAPAGAFSVRVGPDGARIESKKVTLPAFADLLSRFLDRPVIDKTEIQGFYDFTMDVAMEELARGTGGLARKAAAMGANSGKTSDGTPDSGTGGTIIQSIQKYGLNLEGRKASMDSLVIDHIEKTATEN